MVVRLSCPGAAIARAASGATGTAMRKVRLTISSTRFSTLLRAGSAEGGRPSSKSSLLMRVSASSSVVVQPVLTVPLRV
jgi:hypothetical protein